MNFEPGGLPPLWTKDLPGIGGRVKARPEDFQVEEIPVYEPSGQGHFLYLWIEKTGMGAEYFNREISRRLAISVGEIGCAGLKDRQAVTRQMISVPDYAEARLETLDGGGIKLLQVNRHGNKLRPGHLRGNRFQVLIRDPDSCAAQRIDPLVAVLNTQGFPNFYGPQRFGREGDTLRLGMALLRSETGQQRPRPTAFLRKLALSAAQSAFYNHYLAARIEAGLFREVLEGDVMTKRPFGGLFVVKDRNVEQRRMESLETVPAGPIFGRKLFPAAAVAAAREMTALEDCGVSPAAFDGFGKLLQGTRRANIVYPQDLVASTETEGLGLTFTLPTGSYATVLLREIMKAEQVLTTEEQ
jgi:tRNA pseudouridine13 synthase